MRRSLLNKRILPKPLRQALVLITLLLLPSAAWGQDPTVTTTFTGWDSTIGILYSESNPNKWTPDPIDGTWSTSTDPSGLAYTMQSSYDIFSLKSDFTLEGSIGNGNKIAEIEIGQANINTSGTISIYQGNSTEPIGASGLSTQENGVVTIYAQKDAEFSDDKLIVKFNSVTSNESSFVIKAIRLYYLNFPTPVSYGLTVAGVQVTNKNAGRVTGDLIGDTGSVTYDAENYILKLTNVNITGFITSSLDELTIELTGTNTLLGSIEDVHETYPHGNLNITGTGSLAITGQDGDAVIRYFDDVTIADGLYIQTNTPGTHWDYDCFKGGGTLVSEMTITPSVYYPIWVLSDGVSYIQVSDANKSHVLGDNITTVTYNSTDEQLILNGFECSTTGGAPAIYLGDQEEFKIYLSGDNTISSGGTGDGVYFNREVAFLTVSTDANNPGKLTLGQPNDGNYSLASVPYDCVIYENGLGFYNNTVSTVWPRLVIGNTQIMGTTDNVLDDENISFDAGTNTLTLSGAVIEGDTYEPDIDVYVKDLIVAISGTNTVNGRFYGHYSLNGDNVGTIHFTKAEGATSPSITISGDTGDSGPVYEFSQCTWDEGLYLTEAKKGTTTLNGVYYNESRFKDATDTHVPDYVLISDQPASVSLWIGDTPVKTDNASNVFAGNTNLDGKVSVTFGDTNILTLDNADIQNYIIVSALPNLTIEFKSGCYWDKIISTNSNATLTFSLAEGAGGDEHDYLCCMPENSGMPWEGFSAAPTFNNNLCYLPNSDSQYITKLRTPQFNMSDGKLIIEKSGENLDQIHAFYSVDFVEGNDVDLKEYKSENPETIDKPCTVTAYTEFVDVFGVKRQSETVTGKYFGIADKTIVFNNNTEIDDLEIIPATKDEGVSFSFRGVDKSDVIMPSQEGNGYKLSIAGIGRCELRMEIDDDNATIQVLNPFESSVSEVKYAKGVVTVIPPAPSFSIEEKEEYLNTDKVELIMPEEMDEDQNASIRYSWVETEVNGTEYNSDSKVQLNAGTGTLYAWVRYSQTDADPILSEKVSMTFENVKINIDQFSVKNMLEESPAYQGSAISVPFTLYDPQDETTTISAENYDVIYKKYVGGDEGYETVESVVDVGTYKVSIKGKGSYGGEKLIYENLVVTQASLEDAAISKLIVGEKEYEYDADKEGFEIPYSGEAIKPNVVVTFNDGTVTVKVSEYEVSYGDKNTEISGESESEWASVTITSKGINFTANTSTTLYFKIVRAEVEIEAEDQEVTYNATAQEYDISKVVVDNENAKVVVTYYATEEDLEGGTALAEAPTNAGTYYVRVTLNEESQQHYVAEPADKTFTINQLSLEGAEITLNYTELTYNGNEQTVSVTKVEVNGIVVDSDNYLVDGRNKGTEAGEYTVTVTAKPDNDNFKNNFAGYATTKWRINHRTASAAELGFESETQTSSTYYNPNESFNLPEGYVAYIITGVNGTEVLTTRVSYIPKGVAVLVEKGTSSDEATENITNTDLLPLKGTVEPLDVISITGGTVYVLYNGEFVKSTSGTIPGKRCYLLIESTLAAGTRAFGINHHMGANGIDSALVYDNDEKAGDKWHDLQGRSIEKPIKAGLYIKNGKKVVIK
jgi:hypothetical protein